MKDKNKREKMTLVEDRKFYREENEIMVDAMDRILVNIHNYRVEHDHKLILMTGCGSTTGTTSQAIHLAQALADTGLRTLYVDADLRKPRKFKSLPAKDEEGLAEFLMRGEDHQDKVHTSIQEDLETRIQSTQQEGFFYLPAGKAVNRSIPMLCSPQMNDLLEFLRVEYDAVIFDTPSINVVPDAKILLPLMDGAILLAALGQTTKRQLRDGRRQMMEQSHKYYGLIVNKVGISDYGKHIKDHDYFHDQRMEKRLKKQLKHKKHGAMTARKKDVSSMNASQLRKDVNIAGNKGLESWHVNARKIIQKVTTLMVLMYLLIPFQVLADTTQAVAATTENSVETVNTTVSVDEENVGGDVGTVTSNLPNDEPKLIVTGYELEEGHILEGEDTTLYVSLENVNNRSDVYSVIVKYSFDSMAVYPVVGTASHTYIERIKPGQTITVPIHISTEEIIDTDWVICTLSIEYTSADRGSETISTPLYLPVNQEYFNIYRTDLPTTATVDEETRISVIFENTGSTDIYNTVMTVKGSGMEDITSELGTVQSGSRKSHEVYITFDSTGEQYISLEFGYDDIRGNHKTTSSSPFRVDVEEVEIVAPVTQNTEEVISNQGLRPEQLIYGVGLLIAIAGSLITWRKTRTQL